MATQQTRAVSISPLPTLLGTHSPGGTRTNTNSGSSPSHQVQDLKKQLRKAAETWKWVCRFDDVDDRSEGELRHKRYGVLRGQIKNVGDPVKLDLHSCKITGKILVVTRRRPFYFLHPHLTQQHHP